MKKSELLPYISICLDDAGSVRSIKDMPTNARLVAWQCGFEPMVVAVWSYLDVKLDKMEAEEIAIDYLEETNWFSGESTPADYIL